MPALIEHNRPTKLQSICAAKGEKRFGFVILFSEPMKRTASRREVFFADFHASSTCV
jgi:hypothetical protein